MFELKREKLLKFFMGITLHKCKKKYVPTFPLALLTFVSVTAFYNSKFIG